MREEIIKDFKKVSSREKAVVLQRFFKTGKGEYGEGDVFIGVVVPDIRSLCKRYFNEIDFETLDFFISSPIHEYRLFALLTLTYQYENGGEELKEKIYRYYLDNTRYINNWDLVDLSAPKIVGDYLKKRDSKVLYELIGSQSMWEQRIAILSTFPFIKDGDFKDILAFSKLLIEHKHDLIHKALGWMLREVGKKDVVYVIWNLRLI